MTQIVKGIIPAAGSGKRMHSISKEIPKEMLTLHGIPIIEYAIRDMMNCGIKDIAIIIHPEKRIMKDYVSDVLGKEIAKEENPPVFTFISQYKRQGLAHALYLAKEFINDMPFTVFLPDNIVVTKSRNKVDYTPLIKLLFEKNTNTLAVMKIFNEDFANLFSDSGKIKCTHISPSIMMINQICKKTTSKLSLKGKSFIYKVFGRYFLLPEILIYIEDLLKNERLKDYDDGPVMRKLAKEDKLYGFLCDCVVYDVGNTKGYFAAKEYFSQQNNSC